jgi:DNA topoisomerase-3
MEEKAILEGFQQMKDGHEYDNLYYSAVARSEADWLVGINATRLFTVLYHHRLIVGRVQTPTLAMLVEREKSIENFQKEKYYLVHLLMDGLDAVSNRIKEKSAGGYEG